MALHTQPFGLFKSQEFHLFTAAHFMNLFPQQFHFFIPEAVLLFFFLTCLLLVVLLAAGLRIRNLSRTARRANKRIIEEEKRCSTLEKRAADQNVHIAKLTTLLENERKNSSEKLALLEEARESLNLQFQSLANRIFDEKSEKFGHENQERVSSLLHPLQDQLRGFQKRIDDIQANDIRERASLKEEIVHLRQLNVQINREATNLTQALRGDTRRQGSWGELVLERVLEKSGLRKGREYSVQRGYRNHDNQLLKPDVIVHLPDNKDIIIDSKVSLSAWQDYISCDQETEGQEILQQHIHNIRNHIKNLSEKSYSDIPAVNSLDFVLLFIPIDSSFAVASETDDMLFSDAYEHRIIIVTPTTLLATLKTVENLWRYEHQNRNSREIAERAGAIYDKLRGFLEDMDKVGKQLSTCHSTYDSAMNKLATGKGNIISQAGKLSELGIKTKKKIPKSISSLADDDPPD